LYDLQNIKSAADAGITEMMWGMTQNIQHYAVDAQAIFLVMAKNAILHKDRLRRTSWFA
jgi:hypothetical protein